MGENGWCFWEDPGTCGHIGAYVSYILAYSGHGSRKYLDAFADWFTAARAYLPNWGSNVLGSCFVITDHRERTAFEELLSPLSRSRSSK